MLSQLQMCQKIKYTGSQQHMSQIWLPKILTYMQ